MSKTITIPMEEFNELKSKASYWDNLELEIGTFYDEENPREGDLLTIGELTARKFGYL